VVVEVLSLFSHEMIVKQKLKIRKTCKICFIFFPISKEKYYWLGEPNIYHDSEDFTRMGVLLGGSQTVKS